MVLGTLDAEVDEVAGVGHDRAEAITEGVAVEGLHFFLRQRLGEPLHVVLHEDLHGRAPDPDAPIDGGGDAPNGRHMGAEERENFGFCGFGHRDEGDEKDGGTRSMKRSSYPMEIFSSARSC